ncbi:MAG TPA: xanthomonadin biosynthesis protein [Rhodanobacteraceae bacterium]|nr:xanthomonadin biosynthesis protein [Rhodanobacteraceae bacterium]
MSATLQIPPEIPTSTRGARHAGIFVAAYLAIVAAAFASGLAWLGEFATVMIATLLLWPGLKRGSVPAILVWLAAAAIVAALAFAAHGEIALDFLPVVVNAALCLLFAQTLAPASTPLIARVIAVLEGPERVALPRVAVYARRLTFAWALLLGAQAVVLAMLIACAVPEGFLAALGIDPPVAITGEAWRAYLHFGSYAAVLAFLALEYAFRRWHLRHIEHASLPVFLARLVRRWPALARSVMGDRPRSGS